MRIVLCVFGVVALAGCENPLGGRTCTLELRSTIVVEVTDARTGAPAPVGSTVIVRGSTFYDSVLVTKPEWVSASAAYFGTEDRIPGGRYSVEVRKPGYVNWLTKVEVKSDECHSGPGPVVQVALQPRS
jgi:hypothetical protein